MLVVYYWPAGPYRGYAVRHPVLRTVPDREVRYSTGACRRYLTVPNGTKDIRHWLATAGHEDQGCSTAVVYRWASLLRLDQLYTLYCRPPGRVARKEYTRQYCTGP